MQQGDCWAPLLRLRGDLARKKVQEWNSQNFHFNLKLKHKLPLHKRQLWSDMIATTHRFRNSTVASSISFISRNTTPLPTPQSRPSTTRSARFGVCRYSHSTDGWLVGWLVEKTPATMHANFLWLVSMCSLFTIIVIFSRWTSSFFNPFSNPCPA